MKLSRSVRIGVLMICLVGCGMPAWAAEQDRVINDLRRMVDAGQYDAAFKAGSEQSALQGSTHFDFLFGVACVNSGHIPQGLLALQRHLAVVPANDRARLELAKGYFELGEYSRARQEFEFVLHYNPPKDVQANIQKYLDAMQTREAASTRVMARSFIEFGMGHDSNANAGTYNTQIELLTGPVLLADPASAETASPFSQITGGAQWLRKVDSSLAVFAGLDLDVKSYTNASEYDTVSLGGYSGFSVLKGAGLYKLTLSDGQMRVNSEKYRNTLSMTGESQYSLGKGYSANAVVQYSELAHSNANLVRDARMMTVGGGIQRTFASDWRPNLGLQVTYAKEANLHLRNDLSRDLLTARVSGQANPTDRLGLSVGIAWQQGLYDQADIAFGTARRDVMWTGDAGMNYLWSRNWLIRADLQYTDNQSNQALYTYRRLLVGLRTRYLF